MVVVDPRFGKALRALSAALDEISAPSMIIGGIAVNVAGFVRYTRDIDATIRGRDSDLESVRKTMAQHGIVLANPSAAAAARAKQVLFLHHPDTGIDIDISFAWFPFEEHAIARAEEVEYEGVALRVAIPEDLIVYKATAWRASDLKDLENLLLLHLDKIDLERVRALLIEIFALLEEPERLAEFEVMVEQARRAREP